MTTITPIPSTTNVDLGSEIMTSLEAIWSYLQTSHPELPPVVITMASDDKKLGNYAHNIWKEAQDIETMVEGIQGIELPEVFISTASLALGGQETMDTLRHEAAHALGAMRGIQNVNKNGTTHNKRFKMLAEEMGLECIRINAYYGWADTKLTEETKAQDAEWIARLNETLKLYRAPTVKKKKGTDRNYVGLECNCGRKVRMSRREVDSGTPVICGGCNEEFKES